MVVYQDLFLISLYSAGITLSCNMTVQEFEPQKIRTPSKVEWQQEDSKKSGTDHDGEIIRKNLKTLGPRKQGLAFRF